MTYSVFLLPKLIPSGALVNQVVVVIDVLRATSTITAALAAGAREVIPCLEVEEARRVAVELGEDARLGGERGGCRIDGFHFGNSPFEYTPESIGGRTLVFTTTNGTRAMQACRAARSVLIGAFVNLEAIAERVEAAGDGALVCAGTDGEVTSEDLLFAGAVLRRLADRRGVAVEGLCGNHEAWLACAAYDAVTGGGEGLLAALRSSRGGENLRALGMEPDVVWCGQLNWTARVGVLNLGTGRIT